MPSSQGFIVKLKKPVTHSTIPELQNAYSRFQGDPRRRLEWVVNLVGNEGRIPKEEDKSRTLLAEMYSFVAAAGLVGTGPLWTARIDAIFSTRPETREPVRRFHNRILKAWQNMIQCALNREAVFVVRDHASVVLTWSLTRSRFIEETWFFEEYPVSAARALGKLLVDYGHLVKECPAPKLRGKPGELCETWFVASRPNKLYCSSACQSRATTSRERVGSVKPKRKKKRKRN